MKRTIENCIECLKVRVANSGLELRVCDDEPWDIQAYFIGIDNVPLISDVIGILSCFFNNAWGITHKQYIVDAFEIYLSDGEMGRRKTVDTKLLQMFIPSNKWEELKKRCE